MRGQVSIEFLLVLLSSLSLLFVSVSIINDLQEKADERMTDEERRFARIMVENAMEEARILGPGNRVVLKFHLRKEHTLNIDGRSIQLYEGMNELSVVNNGSITVSNRGS